MICQCRFCRRADHWFRQETEHAKASLIAQKRGDYTTAASEDRARLEALRAAGRCISQCEGGETMGGNPFNCERSAIALAQALWQSKAVNRRTNVMLAIAEDFAEYTDAARSGRRRFLRAFERQLGRLEARELMAQQTKTSPSSSK